MTEYALKTPQQLGPVLRGYQKEQRQSQRDVGARSALPQPAFSHIETDPSRTALSRLFKVLAALDLELVVRARKPGESSSEW